MRRSICGWVVFAISTLIGSSNGLGLECTMAPCKLPDESTIRFFVIGDWGGISNPPFVTKAEQQCARFISDTGPGKKPHFFVSTGDNFYEYGVRSADDPRFKATWDDVFVYGKEEKIPWFVALGNHDWYGNPMAQVEYTYLNDRWVSPGFVFTTSYDARPHGPSIDLVFMDTVVMCGNTWEDSEDHKEYIPEIDKTGHKTEFYRGPVSKIKAEKIWNYVEQAFARSTADYLFAVGHYPAFSSTHHNISDCLVPRLQELMEKYDATGFLNGHAHNLQHLTTTNRLTGQPIHHILSGAGHKSTPNYVPVFANLTTNPYNVSSQFFFPHKNNGTKEFTKVGGLVFAELGPRNGTFEYYRCDGEMKHRFEVQARTVADQ